VKLQAGLTLVSAVDTTSVIVLRAPEDAASLTCGGVEMAPKDSAVTPAEADPALMGGTQLGKRYVTESGSLEVLCVKGGEGSLALDGELLTIQQAKPLPSSD
jgi:hypothetical protein